MRTIGIERERFIVDAAGNIVSGIGTLLPEIHRLAGQVMMDARRFTYELFAGQVEDKTPPYLDVASIKDALMLNDEIMVRAANKLGFGYEHSEFVQKERILSSLEVNPFDKRHQEIWRRLPRDSKIAASAVAAVHVHIGVDDTTAVRVLNYCRPSIIEELIGLGDHSGRNRIASYRTMAKTDGVPPRFASFSEVMTYIASKGGEKNVWDLVRYKPSTGTIEFRMFGATSNIQEIIGYIKACFDVIP